jgi:hypothetical protein
VFVLDFFSFKPYVVDLASGIPLKGVEYHEVIHLVKLYPYSLENNLLRINTLAYCGASLVTNIV